MKKVVFITLILVSITGNAFAGVPGILEYLLGSSVLILLLAGVSLVLLPYIWVGVLSGNFGRSRPGWILFSVIATPIISLLMLLLLGNTSGGNSER